MINWFFLPPPPQAWDYYHILKCHKVFNLLRLSSYYTFFIKLLTTYLHSTHPLSSLFFCSSDLHTSYPINTSPPSPTNITNPTTEQILVLLTELLQIFVLRSILYSSKIYKIITVAGEIPSRLVEGLTETVKKYLLWRLWTTDPYWLTLTLPQSQIAVFGSRCVFFLFIQNKTKTNCSYASWYFCLAFQQQWISILYPNLLHNISTKSYPHHFILCQLSQI